MEVKITLSQGELRGLLTEWVGSTLSRNFRITEVKVPSYSSYDPQLEITITDAPLVEEEKEEQGI